MNVENTNNGGERMNINVTLKIDSPEVVQAILTLAQVFQKGIDVKSISNVMPEVEAIKSEKVNEPVVVQKSEVVVKTITIEEVRAKLAALSQAGKQKEVKALIEKYGGKKLTDIKSDKYGDLLKEAEVL